MREDENHGVEIFLGDGVEERLSSLVGQDVQRRDEQLLLVLVAYPSLAFGAAREEEQVEGEEGSFARTRKRSVAV